MKRRFYFLLLLSAIVLLTSNINLRNEKSEGMSPISLANIEALAQVEVIANTRKCSKTISMKGETNPTHITYCGSCDAQLARVWEYDGACNHSAPL